MIRKFILFVSLFVSFFDSSAQSKQAMLMDNDWTFHLGGAQGAEAIQFNDSSWSKVDLPHDWGIEDLKGTSSPFDKAAISQVSGGFTTGGTGWYRKTFNVATVDKGKKLFLEFEGVYMNADVWINGFHLGNHPYGYTSFIFDITDHVRFDSSNVIAVEVKNEGENSRWYSGSGIYRHVWLEIMNPVHLAQWQTFITTPYVNTSVATVDCKTTIANETGSDAEINFITKVLSPSGDIVATANSKAVIKANTSLQIQQKALVKKPLLWSCESPQLYNAVFEIYDNARLISTNNQSFGIRKISFDTKNGFQLNGKTVKLKGGCFHNDNGPLGSKQYDRAEERKVELLKASGFNAIRCSHNPQVRPF